MPNIGPFSGNGHLCVVERVVMSTLTLRILNEPIITLPADLAERAGLREGAPVQVIVSDEGLELRPSDQTAPAYDINWPARRAQLRERAVALGLYEPDRRDDVYWQIVTPLMAELDHELYS
jgi:bifunctional DNA-binding transcriptional regulator/antitoxin component of YhaV-PrlF toxin-antitoxin module